MLEVAPNMGTTTIHIARTYGCKVVAVDLHRPSLEKAKENVKKAGLEDQIEILVGDARNLPFSDGTFDAVINEAMLTMLPNKGKQQALQEYYRVLKKGGRLGTHDVGLQEPLSPKLLDRFHKQLKIPATPLTVTEWNSLFAQVPFSQVEYHATTMSLMSLDGMLIDEGWEGTIQILQNSGQSEEKRARFLEMASFFSQNSHIFGSCTFHAIK